MTLIKKLEKAEKGEEYNLAMEFRERGSERLTIVTLMCGYWPWEDL
jgi:hypothetical protein